MLSDLTAQTISLVVLGCLLGGMVNQGGLVWTIRRSIDFPRLWPFLAGGAVGVPVGVMLVLETNPRGIQIALALFMIVYGIYALLGPRLPHVSWGGRIADAGAG